MALRHGGAFNRDEICPIDTASLKAEASFYCEACMSEPGDNDKSVEPNAQEDAAAEAKDAIAVSLKVNGKKHELRIDPRTSLLDCLREHLHLTGSKKGCDHGQCGACTVHINGRRQLSCLSFAALHEGDEIMTIEGIGQPEKMDPMQAAFVSCDAYQCGYCTSGQIMSAVALLKEPCGPDDAEVKEFMSGNICRCGAYPNIVAAIQKVRQGTKAV
jgi:xanthine dehydrogenase YagT iron-sulfur-binding subunit